ncbi:hypothetical protein, partial [Neobacillus paridis]|uniref:hypothetical protein n=1 Tax=Neobacillus paridis TaxID=2803862 RepID=UPI001F36DD29
MNSFLGKGLSELLMGWSNEHFIVEKPVKSLFMCKFTGKCFQPSPLIFLAKLPWIFYFISGKGCQMVF